MYQPRRVAGPDEIGATLLEAVSVSPSAPRRALPTLGDRVFAGGSVALAVVTATATAGAVAVGSSGDLAVAAGTADSAIESGVRTLTAEELDAPAVGVTAVKSSQAAKSGQALVSLTRLYTTGSLNVRAEADVDSDLLGKIALGSRVSATGDLDGRYRQIEYGDGFGWVLAKELSEAGPEEAAAGTTMAACSRGSAVEGKLRKDTVHIYRSVCALFPAVNSFGGWRAGGRQFHKNGRALDIMLTPRAESALGKRIANYLIQHARDFNIDHIIFEQKIWTPGNPHWRKMADRGGITANHFDHVHVAIRG